MCNDGKIYLPLDFNSLCNLRDGKLKLSEYYIDYAFSASGLVPNENIPVIFYDYYWLSKDSPIPALAAVLNLDEDGLWKATVKDRIFLSNDIPVREYVSPFIGSSSFRMENSQKAIVQKLGDDPKSDVLGGISSFACAPGSQFPDFTKMVGMNAEEVANFFTFSDIRMLPPQVDTFGRMLDETQVFRGGRNRNDN